MSRKIARRIGWGFAVIVLFYAGAGALLLPALVRQQAIPLLQQRLGDGLTLGPIRVNPFQLSVSLHDFWLPDRQGATILSFESVAADLALWPLLRGEVLIEDLHLEGVHLGIHRLSPTESNLQQLVDRWNATAPQTSDSDSDDSDAGAALPPVHIAHLSFSGGSVGLLDDVPETPFQTHIEAINFSLSNLSTVANAQAAEHAFTLALGDGSQMHWQGSLSLVPLATSGELALFGPLTDELARYFDQQLPVSLRGGWFDTGMSYALALSDQGQLSLSLQGMQLAMTDLDILDKEGTTLLARLPSLALTGGEMALADRRVHFDRLHLEAFEFYPVRLPDGDINFLRLLPEPSPASTEEDAQQVPASPSSPWTISLSELALERWDIHLSDLQPAPPVRLNLAVNARATNLSNQPGVPLNLDTDIAFSTGGRLRAGASLEVLPALQLDGEFTLDALALSFLQPYLAPLANVRLESGQLSAQGDVVSGGGQNAFVGSVRVDSLGVTDTLQNESLAGLESLQIEALDVRMGEQIRIDIGEIALERPYARVEIEADGSTNISRLMIDTAPRSASPDAAEGAQANIDSSPGDLPELRLDRVRVRQGVADFSDSSLPLPFAVHMDNLTGEISSLSTTSAEPARVHLEGQVDAFGLASISGRVRPLAFAELTEMDLQFRNLDIPSLSPYVIKFAGRKIAAGNLDVDVSYRIRQSQLEGENAMVLRDLELGERVPHPDALDLPLGLAIALLKDRNGVIDLDVPVTGDLENPQFSYGGVISRALSSIIRNIVASPFRFLSSLVGGDEDTDLSTIAFAPGRSDLLPPEREKLISLGSALVERPQLQLGVAGVVMESADRAVLQERFLDTRAEEALAVARLTAPEGLTPSALRLQVMEQLYRDSAEEDGPAVEQWLTEQREAFTQPDAQGVARFDELAYLAQLRRELIAKEPVAQAQLEALAEQRVQVIVAALTAQAPELAARVVSEPLQTPDALEDGAVPLPLRVSALPR